MLFTEGWKIEDESVFDPIQLWSAVLWNTLGWQILHVYIKWYMMGIISYLICGTQRYNERCGIVKYTGSLMSCCDTAQCSKILHRGATMTKVNCRVDFSNSESCCNSCKLAHCEWIPLLSNISPSSNYSLLHGWRCLPQKQAFNSSMKYMTLVK